MKNFKKPLIILLAVFGLAAGGFFLIQSLKTKPQEISKKIPEAVNTVPVSDRPYVTLEPTQSKHPAGTEVQITVHTVTLNSTEAEYELEYQAGSLLQGAFGSMDFTFEKPPVSKVLLLGTCSAGGKCDYNQDVTGGTLLLRLSGGDQKFAVKGEWSYQLMSERQGQFSSRDSKFRVDVGEKGLPASQYVVVMQTMGLPDQVDGEILVGPYFISAGSAKIKSAEASFRLSETVESAQLLSWSGSKWVEIDSEIKDQTLTADIDTLGTFLVTAVAE